MGRLSRPSLGDARKSSTLHYQTFPTIKPPASRGAPPSPSSPSGFASDDSNESGAHRVSPLPIRQLAILAVISLAEQTALNSISPYLPEMVTTFPEVSEDNVGLYVGLIASSFALAQFATNFFWGWLSDHIGRKPVILMGTLFTAACMVAFGFCRTLWQAIIVQIFMGLVNGNSVVVSTCLGEITDKSNQSRAFTYLPVVYGLGAITGPIVGGLMVVKNNPFKKGHKNPYPYLAPNLFSAAILMIDLALTMFFLEESLEEAKSLPPLGKRIQTLFAWVCHFAGESVRSPSYFRRIIGKHRHPDGVDPIEDEDSDDMSESQSSIPALLPNVYSGEHISKREVLNRDTVLLLFTFLIFQFANIAYNSLFPIFAQAPPPTGRSLSPTEIGISLSFAGFATILFQVGFYGKLREKIGNKVTYRVSMAAFVVAFLLMPWVGYKDGDGKIGLGRGKTIMWIELGFVLIIKTVAAVGGLTSALLLITNSAPNHSVLGTLNGLAQTLSAAGRAIGPFISGSLFSAATHIRPKGEAMAFGVFGGVAFVGFLLSLGIRGAGLEADDWGEEEGFGEDYDDDGDDEDADDEAEDNDATKTNEQSRLLPSRR